MTTDKKQIDKAYDVIVERGLEGLSVRGLAALANVGRTTANEAIQRMREELRHGHTGRLLALGRASSLVVDEKFYDEDGRLIRTERVTVEPEEEQPEMLDPVSDFAEPTPAVESDGTVI